MDNEDWMDLCPQGGLEPDEAKRIWAVLEAAKSFMNWCRDTPEYERDYRLLEEAVEALDS